MAEPREIILPVSEEEYQKAGSKFITFPPGARVGDWEYRDIECGMIDWFSPGKSMQLPVVVTEEGPDFQKEESISFGVDVKGIWKGKEIYKAITGADMPMKKGTDGKKHPVIEPLALSGKPAVGAWQMLRGHKGGDEKAEEVVYPKLVNILPPGSKPVVQSLGV